MDFVWVVRLAEAEEDILVFDNPTAAYDACVDYINGFQSEDDFVQECLEELRGRFLDNSNEFWCEEVCWCWRQKIRKS